MYFLFIINNIGALLKNKDISMYTFIKIIQEEVSLQILLLHYLFQAEKLFF
jgi:hypothetical protein